MELKAKEVSQLLKLIANPYRLMILCMLEEGEKTVSELHEKIESISMPALSQHLSALRLAGLIDNEKHVFFADAENVQLFLGPFFLHDVIAQAPAGHGAPVDEGIFAF